MDLLFEGVRLNRNVSPLVGGLVLLAACVVAIWTLWQAHTGESAYAQVSVTALRTTLASLPLPPGTELVGAPKLVDRMTIATAEQNYASDSDPNEVAKFYQERLAADGWREDMVGNGAPGEIWFCKDGLLSAVVFLSESQPVRYRVGLISGGWASSRCG